MRFACAALLGLVTIVSFCAGGCSGSKTDTDVDTDSDFDTETDADAGPTPGSLFWAQHLGGSDYVGSAWHIGNLGRSVSALSDGTFYAGGSFVNEAVFGAGTSNEVTLQSAGGFWDADAFIGRWRPDGAPEWVIAVGGDPFGKAIQAFIVHSP